MTLAASIASGACSTPIPSGELGTNPDQSCRIVWMSGETLVPIPTGGSGEGAALAAIFVTLFNFYGQLLPYVICDG